MARHDGLEKLEMDPLYLVQHFQDRLDLLYYRKVDYQLGGQGQVGSPKRNVLVRTERGKCVCVEFTLPPVALERGGGEELRDYDLFQYFVYLYVPECCTLVFAPSHLLFTLQYQLCFIQI